MENTEYKWKIIECKWKYRMQIENNTIQMDYYAIQMKKKKQCK
jgi:hypothetical protein